MDWYVLIRAVRQRWILHSFSICSFCPGESWSWESQARSGEGVSRPERWPAFPHQRQTGRWAQKEEVGGSVEWSKFPLQWERAAEERAVRASLKDDGEPCKQWQESDISRLFIITSWLFSTLFHLHILILSFDWLRAQVLWNKLVTFL